MRIIEHTQKNGNNFCRSFLCYIFSEVVTKVTYTITGNGVELSSEEAEKYRDASFKKNSHGSKEGETRDSEKG